MKAETLKQYARKICLAAHHTEFDTASSQIKLEALGKACMLLSGKDWAKSEQALYKHRYAAYISAEFLTGRAVTNNLLALGLLDEAKKWAVLEDEEDAALGNGGLGRLAACFLDSAAALDMPVIGYGLKYRYGLFKQETDGFDQKELPDDWTRSADHWTVRRDKLAQTIELEDGPVRAVPYDMPVFGYKNGNVGTLRLWQTESPSEFNFALFNDYKYAEACKDKNRAEDITKVLYPNDWDIEGKRLRLKQQYTLASASLKDMLSQADRLKKSVRAFAKDHAIQLNDTHPVLAIPELIRLLTKRGMSFKSAFNCACQVFGYTNHTVMPEALEKWDMKLLASVQAEVAAIIKRIHVKCKRETGLSIIENGSASMAALAVYVCRYVNGVAKIHSELLKTSLFKDWYAIYPGKFQNKTNGITPRRWLGLCNPGLTALINEYAGGDVLRDLAEIKNITTDAEFYKRFDSIKLENKKALAKYLYEKQGFELPEGFIVDVQIKRLHEYKRQLLNALSLYDIYMDMKDGKLKELPPVCFIFAGKAAPGYARAKAVIRYINALAERVNSDPDVNKRMRVCFCVNYNCSAAEKLIPAADFSEQISPVGTEASGTGNMKLMLNGAVTIGTLDGANIEIAQEAGEENEFIFGGRLEDLMTEGYRSLDIYENNARVRRAVDSLTDAGFPDEDGALKELKSSLLYGASWHKPDHYYVLRDFEAYRQARLDAYRFAKNEPEKFLRMCVNNTLSASEFSSDRTVRQYAEEIWHI